MAEPTTPINLTREEVAYLTGLLSSIEDGPRGDVPTFMSIQKKAEAAWVRVR